MRTVLTGLLIAFLAVAAFGPAADAASGNFELYGHISHAQLSLTVKDSSGGEDKLSSPGYGINIGGRYWLRNNLALGIMADWVQDRATIAGSTLFDFRTTGFLGTISYKFTENDRLTLTGTAGVGPYTAKGELVGSPKFEWPSTVGFLVGLELSSKITDRATLGGHLGYRTVSFKEAKGGGPKLSMNAFTLGVGLGYRF